MLWLRVLVKTHLRGNIEAGHSIIMKLCWLLEWTELYHLKCPMTSQAIIRYNLYHVLSRHSELTMVPLISTNQN